MLSSIVVFENVTDLKQKNQLKQINLENFIHKIGFIMSRDDALSFLMHRDTYENGETDVAVYTDPEGRSHSFKPFAIKK